jgi:hypothetical protein
MVKDIRIAMSIADDEALALPFSAAGQGFWKDADRAAGPGASVSELVRAVEKLTGVEIKPQSR